MPAIVSIAYSPTHLPAEPEDHYQRVPLAHAGEGVTRLRASASSPS